MIQRNLMTNKTRMNRIHILSFDCSPLYWKHGTFVVVRCVGFQLLQRVFSRFQRLMFSMHEQKWRCLRLVMDVKWTVFVCAEDASPLLCAAFNYLNLIQKVSLIFISLAIAVLEDSELDFFSPLLPSWDSSNWIRLWNARIKIFKISNHSEQEPCSLYRRAHPVAVLRNTHSHNICSCVRSFVCVWFSHFQFVADFHTENSSLSIVRAVDELNILFEEKINQK